ncbi:polysaccharide deacetylase family protein [Flavobacterium sp. SM2513]|uniref:polysaccharide deacetylase family protein n=1 Tax=Flavobacterium sp. SM2513 TaxID=3424766 RepID=UPI003D7F6860
MGIVKDVLYKASNKNLLSVFKNQSIFPYYHLVRDNQVPHITHLYPYKNSKQFLADLDLLSANYKSLHPKDLLENKKSGNTFLLTFDDGLHEIYSVIFPILKEKKINAVFFINPNFVENNEGLYKHYISIIITHLDKSNYDSDSLLKISKVFNFTFNNVNEFKKNFIGIPYSQREKVKEVLTLLNLDIHSYLKNEQPYITKKQIQEMIDAGFYFGGHTMNHPPLHQLSHQEQKKEIIDSVDWLRQNFNIDYSFFAFPFSDKAVSKTLLQELFTYDKDIILFGNSGLKKDIDSRIIQRFSLENPTKNTAKQIVTENLYKYFNKLIGKYNIQRK